MSFIEKLLKVLRGLFGDAQADVVPVGKAPVGAEDPRKSIVVQLGVVSVRRQGKLVTDEVMAPGGVLMAGDKVFLDSSELYEDGSPVPEELKQPPDKILWKFYYANEDVYDLVVKGDEFKRSLDKDQKGKHFLVSHQGLIKLEDSEGHAIVVKLAEGEPGTSLWQAVCSHNGVDSNPVGGRAD